MAELFTLKPLFPGHLGTPKFDQWPEGYRLIKNLNMQFPNYNRKDLRNLFYDISDEGINFLECIFQYDSEKRPAAKDLLKHPYLNMNLSSKKIEKNNYRSQSRKENLMPLKEFNNIFNNLPIHNQKFFNYKIISDEKNDYNNNKLNSPTFFLPQINNNKSINASSPRFNNDEFFFNKKAQVRSKSTAIELAKNLNNINDNNIYDHNYNNRLNNNYNLQEIENQ